MKFWFNMRDLKPLWPLNSNACKYGNKQLHFTLYLIIFRTRSSFNAIYSFLLSCTNMQFTELVIQFYLQLKCQHYSQYQLMLLLHVTLSMLYSIQQISLQHLLIQPNVYIFNHQQLEHAYYAVQL